MKYGFVYIWRDRKYNRYYIGSHWGREDDGYICSSPWMKISYQNRPLDFKRRIIEKNIKDRKELFEKELYWLSMIKPNEVKPLNTNPKYYNLNIRNNEHWLKYPDKIKSIGQKISAKKTGISTGPCSEEKRQKIREATTGVKKTYTEESYQRLVDTHKGSKHTQEWKDANGIRMADQWASGKRKGKEFQTEESNRKRSEAMKGRNVTIPTEESRKKQSEKKKIYWQNVKAGLIPPRKPRNKKEKVNSPFLL